MSSSIYRRITIITKHVPEAEMGNLVVVVTVIKAYSFSASTNADPSTKNTLSMGK